VQNDLYTKAMLTIIAACLMYLALGGPSIVPAAQAASEPMRMLLSGWVDANGHVQQLPSARERTSALPVDTFQR
jgi:hypothetical protein